MKVPTVFGTRPEAIKLAPVIKELEKHPEIRHMFPEFPTDDLGGDLTNTLLEKIRETAIRRVIYTEHALDRMNAESEMITFEEVREVVVEGEIIEDYPEDVRGHSCLMLGFTRSGRPVHVVCAPKERYLGIITVYVPSEMKWKEDFKTRRQGGLR